MKFTSSDDAMQYLWGALYSSGADMSPRQVIDAALEQFPDDSMMIAKTLVKLGLLLMKMHRPGEAYPYLAKAASLQPKNAWLYDSAGKCLVRAQRLAEAVEWYREGYARFPADVVIRGAFCHSLCANGQYDEAIQLADRIISSETGRERAFAYSFKARALFEKGDEEAALALLESTSEALPVNAKQCRLRADLLHRANRHEDALYWMEESEAFETPPRDGYHYTLKAQIYDKLGYPVSAMEEIEKRLAIHPDHGKTLLLKTHLLIDSGKFFLAFKAAEKASEALPDHTGVLSMLGVAALHLENPKPHRALEAAEKILKQEPESVYGLGIAGRACLLLGQVEKARPRIEALLAVDPENRPGHQLMACVELASGRKEEGLARLHRLQQAGIDPTSFSFLRKLAAAGIGTQSYQYLYKTACDLGVLDEKLQREFKPLPVGVDPTGEKADKAPPETIREIVKGYVQSSFYKKAESNFSPVDRTAYHVKYNKSAPDVEGRNLGFAGNGKTGKAR